MGYWPAKITCFLNIIIMLGYGVIVCVITGQVLSAVSGGSIGVVVGIVITTFCSWIIAVFGMALFQTYERSDHLSFALLSLFITLIANRWAGIPQLIVLLVLVGIAGKNFNISSESAGGSADITTNRLSFFSLSLSAPVSWSAAGSDFYVYVSQDLKVCITFNHIHMCQSMSD